MRLKNREKILLVSAVVAIAILAFDQLYYTPRSRKISGLKSEVKTTDQKLAELSLLTKGTETVEAEITSLEQELDRLNKKTLKGEEFKAFLKHLARESDPLQMKVISLLPQEEKQTLPEKQQGPANFQYRKVNVQMVLHSTYSKLGTYLKEIGDLPFLINVDSLQVERTEETQPLLKVTIDLSMHIMML
jgi:Tfp pilus assembly protein PilO